jgi:MMPL family
MTMLTDRKRHVAAVDDPYTTPGDISQDGKTLVSHLKLDIANPVDMPITDSKKLLGAAQAAERPGLDVALGGQTIQAAEQGAVGSEGIGIAAAAIILLLTFGTVVAAGLPILVAVAGLAVSSTLIGLVAAVVDVPDWSTSLAAMMGIGIGIDYMLLMVTRFKEWREAGLDPQAATVATLDTAGRSVLVAGSTVVVSMLGLFAMGLSFMRGAALVTIMAVLVVMAAAVTLFPALLGYFGRWVDRLRIPLGRRRQVQTTADGHVVPSAGWTRWSRLTGRHSVIASLAGVGVLLVLAAPFLGARFGFPDAGNDPAGRSTRQAYGMLAEGFGPGANGPLVVVTDLADGADKGMVNRLAGELRSTPGVAAVQPPQLNPAGDTALLTVIPATGPQDTATEDLVRTLREDVIPAATGGAADQVHVGGGGAPHRPVPAGCPGALEGDPVLAHDLPQQLPADPHDPVPIAGQVAGQPAQAPPGQRAPQLAGTRCGRREDELLILSADLARTPSRPPRAQIGQADLIEPVDHPPDPRPRRRPPAGQSPAPGCHWPTHDDRRPAHPTDLFVDTAPDTRSEPHPAARAACDRGQVPRLRGRERPGKFVLTKGAGGNYHFTLVAPNGQVIRHQRDLPARAGSAERDRISKEERTPRGDRQPDR